MAIARSERGDASVVPVLLRAVDMEGAPFAKFQGLPTDLRPVTSWLNRDEAWTDVAKGIFVPARMRAIGYVPQDIQLFAGTLRDNLVSGARYVEDDLVLQAAELAERERRIRELDYAQPIVEIQKCQLTSLSE
mgnify:CR=1 FL=1